MALSASRGHDSHVEWDGRPSAEGSAGVPSHVLDGAGVESVLVPDKSFLTDGQFVRSGDDLKIELPDGRTTIVEGYFQGAGSPDLVAPDGGAILAPSLVQSFLGSLTPGQYAQAAPTAAAQPIGHVDALRTATDNQPIYHCLYFFHCDSKELWLTGSEAEDAHSPFGKRVGKRPAPLLFRGGKLRFCEQAVVKHLC